MQNDSEQLPPHVEQTVRAIEQLHTDHHNQATLVDHLLDRAKARLSHPAFIAAVTLFVALWIGANIWLRGAAWDPPPFPYLEQMLALVAVYMTALILATQRRADRLASHREQLTLQLAFVNEQKTGKIIALIEELRRDSPQVKNRKDLEAEEMTGSVSPGVVSKALREIDPNDNNNNAKAIGTAS